MTGALKWVVPDAYFPECSVKGPYISHEAICAINTSDLDAEISITLYFEDEEPMADFHVLCPARRTNHIRLDKIRNENGLGVPKGKAYSILLQSSCPIICQYTRVDTTQKQMSLMTTMAYPVQ